MLDIKSEPELKKDLELLLQIHSFLCYTLMEPSNFIIETKPIGIRPHPKKLARTHQRPTYTYLKLNEIKKRYNLTGGHGTPLVTGHPRRRHKRTYRNDRYIHMKGKTIEIPAMWIGPKQVQIKNKIYRVCVDI